MTLQQLIDALSAICEDTFELAFPKGAKRGIVWHAYGRQSVFGDDRRVLSVPRVQLDLLWQDAEDTLLDDVRAILDEAALCYTEENAFYDESYERMRCILQLTVV